MPTEPIQWTTVIIVVSALAFAAFYFWYDIQRKKQLKEEKKPLDILTRAIIISILAVGLLWLGGWMGIVDKHWLEENKWIYLVVFGCIMLAFYYVYKKMMPLEIDEMYYKFVLPKIEDIYHAKPYTGAACFDPLQWAKRTKRFDKDLNMEVLTDSFLVDIKAPREIFAVLMQYDPVRKTLIYIQKNPPQSLIYSLLSQEAKETYQEFMRVVHGKEKPEEIEEAA